MKIAVTGIGAASAAGPDSAALFAALRHPRSLFAPSKRHTFGFEVTVAEATPSTFVSHPHGEFDSPTGRLCLSAARECTAHAISGGGGSPDGLAVGTTTGGQSENERVILGLFEGRPAGPYSFRRQGCIPSPARLIGRDLEILGPVTTLSTACTSSANAIALASTWIASGRCRRVLAGGGDALCYTTLSSFHILELTGPHPCTPFGAVRPGLTLSDGAGFLMLESLDAVLSEGRVPLAVLRGFGMSSDAHHMTSPPEDGAGAVLALRRALNNAQLTPADIAYVNAHGTGTRMNDAVEARAIREVFGDVPVMSCKGLLGHALGGGGALEAVATVLSIREGEAFENVGASEAGADCAVRLIGSGGLSFDKNKAVVSNSFAFGGNNCVLVFSAKSGGPP